MARERVVELRRKVDALKVATGNHAEALAGEVKEELAELEEVGFAEWVKSNPKTAAGLAVGAVVLLGVVLAVVV